MKESHPGFLARHKNLLIVSLLLTTLIASTLSHRQQPSRHTAAVSLPFIAAASVPEDAVAVFRQQRDTTAAEDMAALQKLVEQENLDDQTRHEAALQLQRLVDLREKQAALEGALLTSGMYPCVAVVSPGSVTIVTEKEVSAAQTALLLTMAQVHADADPSSVRVISGN